MAPVVEGAGLFLEDVVIRRHGRRTTAEIVVDLPEEETGGLGSKRLEDVSRLVAAALDTSDPFPGEYVLEVATPGVGRPLTEPRHFRRARGRLLHVALDDGTTVEGRVADADADGATLTVEDSQVVVRYPEIRRATVQVELNPGSSDASKEV